MEDLDRHLTAIQGGDPDAFQRWVAAAEATVRLGLRSFAAVVDTEAVLQETLLRRVAGRPPLRPRRPPQRPRPAGGAHRAQQRRQRAAAGADGRTAASKIPPATPRCFPVIRCSGRPSRPAARSCAAARRRPWRRGWRRAAASPDELLAERLSMRLNTFLQNFTRARRQLAECLERQGVDLALEHV